MAQFASIPFGLMFAVQWSALPLRHARLIPPALTRRPLEMNGI
jgi:hypothetical protein